MLAQIESSVLHHASIIGGDWWLRMMVMMWTMRRTFAALSFVRRMLVLMFMLVFVLHLALLLLVFLVLLRMVMLMWHLRVLALGENVSGLRFHRKGDRR